jgi:hypothetical protein
LALGGWAGRVRRPAFSNPFFQSQGDDFMNRLRLIGLAFVVMGALGAALSTTAQALPEFLPFTGNRALLGVLNSTEAIFENNGAVKVKCLDAVNEGGLETDTLGTFHIDFEHCSSGGFTCMTEGDVAGLVLAEGSFHYVYDALGTGETLGTAILLLFKEAGFNCAGGILNNKVKGKALCLILAPLTSSTSHRYHCVKGTNAGEAAEKTYWLDDGTAAAVQLLSSLNAGEFKETNLQELASIETLNAGSWMNE